VTLLVFSGRLAISVVREFLEFFKMDYSLMVFDPESEFVSTI